MSREFLRGRLQILELAAGNHYISTCFCKTAGYGLADSSAASSDNRDFSLQIIPSGHD